MNHAIDNSVRKIGDREFHKLSSFIEQEVGIKLPPVKRTLLESRLQKRLKSLSIPDFGEYCDFVFNTDEGALEVIEMIDAVTTNKTDFMRESAHFEFMVHTALPELMKNKSEIKLWSAACSSGQEPYNMAMFMEEFIERTHRVDYSITATDISKSSLVKARRAVYQMRDIEIVSEQFKKKYFLRSRNPESSEIRIKPDIRNKVFFQPINLMKEDYGLNVKFDIVFCRNVLIYFNKENQSEVIRRILNHMNSGAYLFLGHSESLAGMRQNLRSVGASVYRKE
ncbi:MAG: chemotaxis protein CheR [Spirochaetales bacterium]|uniref:protein-glutamate O-methyltransferase n=1 Tax=Candidatus Thalassospirochaeta sargassi TaxID=3119039 RepID=A0AAJ1MM18_9SPIO|nr:chemotaxis protein CheR [Spirochaetales bacterium]